MTHSPLTLAELQDQMGPLPLWSVAELAEVVELIEGLDSDARVAVSLEYDSRGIGPCAKCGQPMRDRYGDSAITTLCPDCGGPSIETVSEAPTWDPTRHRVEFQAGEILDLLSFADRMWPRVGSSCYLAISPDGLAGFGSDYLMAAIGDQFPASGMVQDRAALKALIADAKAQAVKAGTKAAVDRDKRVALVIDFTEPVPERALRVWTETGGPLELGPISVDPKFLSALPGEAVWMERVNTGMTRWHTATLWGVVAHKKEPHGRT